MASKSTAEKTEEKEETKGLTFDPLAQGRRVPRPETVPSNAESLNTPPVNSQETKDLIDNITALFSELGSGKWDLGLDLEIGF